MEGNDWYNRTGYTDYRNHFRGDDRPIDQRVFIGSDRFDEDSSRHNDSAYNRNERRGQLRNDPRSYERTPDHYNAGQSFYSNESRNQHRDSHRDNERNRNDYRQGYWQDEETHRPESNYRSTHISGNFQGNYSPDQYRSHDRNENYGNMAGSLSVGYDGDQTSDWTENRHYNPLTGHRRSYHGNYTSRHPDSGNERLGRSFDRNDSSDYERY